MEWSKKDIARLKLNYPTCSDGFLLRMFPGRSYESIARKARRLGLKREREWTPEDEQKLLYFWPRMPHKDVAIVMERSYWSVSCKYSRLTAIKKKSK